MDLPERVVARTDGTVHELAPVAIPAPERRALRAWVVRERARWTIEAGLGYAVSSIAICEGLAEVGGGGSRHVAIDPHQTSRFSDCGLQLLADAGFSDLVELHREESQIVLPAFLAEHRSFDLAFVDGSHVFDAVFLDLVYLGRLVRGGGVVFVDDWQLPSVGAAVSFCLTNLGWAVEDASRVDPAHNWVVLRTPHEPLERAWDHFVDF